MRTDEEVSDDESGEDDGHAEYLSLGPHAVVQGLDPFSAEDAEHHHEGVEEVAEVPPRQRVATKQNKQPLQFPDCRQRIFTA